MTLIKIVFGRREKRRHNQLEKLFAQHQLETLFQQALIAKAPDYLASVWWKYQEIKKENLFYIPEEK